MWWVAGILALSAIANVLFITHPLLLIVAAVAAPLLGGLIARAFAGAEGTAPAAGGEATAA